MTRVARVYVRLSQSSERSIESQIHDCREYCENHDDLELDHVYNEGQFASGWNDSREQYQQMLNDAQEGEFDALVVRDGSRLGRNKKERFRAFLNLDSWGVEFHTRERGYVDPDASDDFIIEALKSWSDDDGKGAEIERLTAAIKDKVDNGDYHGQPPMGTRYTDDKRALEADDDFDRAREIIAEKDADEPPTHRALAAEYDVSAALVTKLLKRRDIYDTIAERGEWRPAYTRAN